MCRGVFITMCCCIMYVTGQHGIESGGNTHGEVNTKALIITPFEQLPRQVGRGIPRYKPKSLTTGLFDPDNHIRIKRDLTRFQSLADYTGWRAYQRGSMDLSVLMEEILIVESSQSILYQYTRTTAGGNAMDIIVDDEMASLNIVITGPTDETDATLTQPGGVIETFADVTTSRRLDSGRLLMAIQNPDVGTWILTRVDDTKDWKVNVTATSSISIDFRLIQIDDTGFHTFIDRNPIIGQKYTVALTVSNIVSTFTSLSVVLQDEAGETISTSILSMSYTTSRTTGHTEITMPSSNVYIQMSGLDSSGSSFIRSSWRQITPVGVDLVVFPVLGQVGAGENITYQLTNNKAAPTTYDVTMSSNVTSSTSKTLTVQASEKLEDSFEIAIATDLQSLVYSVSVQDDGGSTTLQSHSYTLKLVSTLCTISTTTNNCNNDDSSCSASQWSATAVFNFDVSIFVVTTGISMTDHITDYSRLYISGDCCSFNVILSAYSVDGQGCQVKLALTSQEGTETDEGSRSILPIIIGSAVGGIVLVLLVIGVYKYIAVKKANSIQSRDPTLNVPEDPFASLNLQRPITAPVATSYTTKKYPLLERDFQNSYYVRPTTGLQRPLSSRPTSGHFSIQLNSRPNSLR